jgi:hypothetical protein
MNLKEIAPNLLVNPDFEADLRQLGLTSIESFFRFEDGTDLSKSNLAAFRGRTRIELPSGSRAYLKRYTAAPIITQINNWFTHRRICPIAKNDTSAADCLRQVGINTPVTIAEGFERGFVFEKRSLSMISQVPGESLERKLPRCCLSTVMLKEKREFIRRLAAFARKFHDTGFRHRDFYLAHIFFDDWAGFYLIDLHRAFKPLVFQRRFQVKDLAQLNYSAPAGAFSRTDRLRFIRAYFASSACKTMDKRFIRGIIAKTLRMAEHDRRHGRPVPFEGIFRH